MASDRVTEGWLILYPSPGDEEGQQEKIAGTLVIARHGNILRRLEGDSTFWNWSFWNGGTEVAYETGPLHGETACVLIDVGTGRRVAAYRGDCNNKPKTAPAWVRALGLVHPVTRLPE